MFFADSNDTRDTKNCRQKRAADMCCLLPNADYRFRDNIGTEREDRDEEKSAESVFTKPSPHQLADYHADDCRYHRGSRDKDELAVQKTVGLER